jgi:opacity protein-like surface antigen
MINRYLLGAGVALAVALGGVQAHAQWDIFGPFPPGAFYLGPEGGWAHLGNNTRSGTFTTRIRTPRGPILRTTTFSTTTNFNSGYNVGGRIGYEWGPWRFEEEYSYRNNNLSSFSGIIGGRGIPSVGSGSVHSNAIMTNAIYDFTFGWPITPHLGAGVGAVNVNYSVGAFGRVLTPVGRVPANLDFDSHTWVFGYQAIAGIRYNINPILALDFDYRFLGTPDFTSTATRCPFEPGFGIGCNHTVPSISRNYHTQNILASLTMKFGAPPIAPPPAPPAPPPPPVHQVYLVFFDWDRYNITPEGMQILEAAAAHWKAGGAVQIQVTGYTDLSGPAGYNQRLSERRANAVAVALVRLGIPRNEMVVAGRGMNDPRVPTALGVREPQNRRVEIVFP